MKPSMRFKHREKRENVWRRQQAMHPGSWYKRDIFIFEGVLIETEPVFEDLDALNGFIYWLRNFLQVFHYDQERTNEFLRNFHKRHWETKKLWVIPLIESIEFSHNIQMKLDLTYWPTVSLSRDEILKLYPKGCDSTNTTAREHPYGISNLELQRELQDEINRKVANFTPTITATIRNCPTPIDNKKHAGNWQMPGGVPRR
jgi:hypothetical protein